MNNINENLIIKQKAEFISNNSGTIYFKLVDNSSKSLAISYLQAILLSDQPLDKFQEETFFLTQKNKQSFENKYYYSMSIVFTICELVNESNYDEQGKICLRNKLRKYTKYFYATKEDLLNNSLFIKIKEKTM